MIPADRELCDRGELLPGRLWSLWEMLRFHADKFVNILNLLNIIEKLLDNPEQFFAIEANAPFAADRLGQLIEQLTALNLLVSKKKAEQLRLIMTKPNPAMGPLAKRNCEDLRERIEHELNGKAIYFVSSRVELLDASAQHFGIEVFDAFPSANDDISEAAACLALGRSTASVMHLMRAAEVALKALGTALGVEQQNDWGSYIREIDTALTARARSRAPNRTKSNFMRRPRPASITSRERGETPVCTWSEPTRRSVPKRFLMPCEHLCSTWLHTSQSQYRRAGKRR